MKPILVLCSCPDKPTASRIALALIAENLAACIHQGEVGTSVYTWQGKIETASECQLFIKTIEAHFDPLCDVIRQLHPYDCPEIISLPIAGGYPPYLNWLQETVSP